MQALILIILINEGICLCLAANEFRLGDCDAAVS